MTTIAEVKKADTAGDATSFMYDPKIVPVEVLESIIGSLGFTASAENQKMATKFMHTRGRISVRTKTTIQPDEKQLAELSGADEWYLRPNGERYYTRNWGAHNDILVMRKARENNAFVFLRSAPGTGKTALTEAAYDDGVETVIGTGDTEVADLVGSYVQHADGTFHWVDGPLIRAMDNGRVLLIDEVGLIDPKVLSLIYGVMDGRRELIITANPERGTVQAQPGFFVVAATNPHAPGVRLSEALLSRFLIHVEMTTDWALARKLGVPDEIVTAAKNLAGKVEKEEIAWSPQFRELIGYRDLAKAFGEKFAIENLLALAPETERSVVADVFSRALGTAVFPARIAN